MESEAPIDELNEQHWVENKTICPVESTKPAKDISMNPGRTPVAVFQIQFANAKTKRDQQKAIQDYAKEYGFLGNVDMLEPEEQDRFRRNWREL